MTLYEIEEGIDLMMMRFGGVDRVNVSHHFLVIFFFGFGFANSYPHICSFYSI